MKVKMIATWDMSEEALNIISNKFDQQTIDKSLIEAIKVVEDNPKFTSVGYGGLPNINGEVELDAAYMCGDTLKLGAIACAKNIANPIDVAFDLVDAKFNNVLVGSGVDYYAHKNGFEFKNMLTEKAKAEYLKKLQEIEGDELKAYDGHDTVCMLGMDNNKTVSVGVSTSGLFMKKPGRVGDSALVGSGYYADSRYGAAAATGVGEELMRGCVSYDVICKLKLGMDITQAVESTLRELENTLIERGQKPRAMSIIAMDNDNNYAVATNVDFPFVILDMDNNVHVLKATEENKKTTIN